MINNQRCPVCNSSENDFVFSHNSIPKYNLNYGLTETDSLSKSKKRVRFVECKKCGFLFNQNFEELTYSLKYESNRSHSVIFKKYLHDIAEKLMRTFNLSLEETFLEIGFGDSNFLKTLLKINGIKSKYIGFDNAYENNYQGDDLKLFNKTYQPGYPCKPNVVILRHVLEHISGLKEFLSNVLWEEPKYLFIEVPCKNFIYDSNFHYFSNEHCSYFDVFSLQKLLLEFDYYLIKNEIVFNSENLIAFFQKDTKFPNNYSRKKLVMKNSFKSFSEDILNKLDFENDFIWGASGKGVMLLNILNIDRGKMPYIVDINPNLWGKFIPCTANKIISPKEMVEYISSKSKIWILNKLYKEEIKYQLRDLSVTNPILPLII